MPIKTDIRERWQEMTKSGDDISAHRKLVGHCYVIVITLGIAMILYVVGIQWGFTLTALPSAFQELYDWLYKL